MKKFYPLIIALLTLTACSTTSSIPEDDHLFVGLTKIAFDEPEDNQHRQNLLETKIEVEAALATAPNGALFGSCYYRTPFPYGLWIWNHFSNKESKFAKWMTNSFGKKPVLMSGVNPALRASVAQQVLKNHGYMHGKVGYDIVDMKNPKKQKIGYNVSFGPLLTIDSIAYVGFSGEADSLIASSKPAIKKGDAFTVAGLDAERTRISETFRNNGYYYYQPSYSIFLADTINTSKSNRPQDDNVNNSAAIRFQLAGGLPPEANRQWYIGRVDISMRKDFMQELTNSLSRRTFTFHFNGDKPPVRPRVLMGYMRMRPRQLYSYEKYLETLNKMNATGLFSMVDINFTPRDTTATCDTLDVAMSCTFERPYDFYVETNFMQRTIGRMGPQVKVGLTKRNAFRGGEKFDVNLHGSYEWSTHSTSGNMNAYEYGADASIEFPRIVAPFFGTNQRMNRALRRLASSPRSPLLTPRKKHFFSTPTTLLKFSTDIIRRPSYYKMHIVSGELTYRWQSSPTSRHEFSPLNVKYQFMNSHTELFDSIIIMNPYLLATMYDCFIPQMRYTYTYTSQSGTLHPIRWETTLSESGNLTSLAMMAFGKKWNEKDKVLFKNPYSQFLRLETDFTKTWQLSTSTQLVGHLHGGIIHAFGNSADAPISEMFYVGGANSIRAFPIRGIGPGEFPPLNNSYSYILQTGELSLVANLELRHRLFGNLHGALFLDAGNIWNINDLYEDEELTELIGDIRFDFKDVFSQMALGTGIGLRYDLDFLILRLDWGIGLHVPYSTSKHGFYNISSFKEAQTLHFAIGYPF